MLRKCEEVQVFGKDKKNKRYIYSENKNRLEMIASVQFRMS
jgi:hypothetical protein